MALFERSVLGLDLGSHGLKAVELRVSPRSLAPGQFRVHPRVDASSPIVEHLQRFIATHSLPLDQVACALPTHQLSTRRLEFPFSDRRRLNQAIPFEIETETPFDLEDIFIDWNLLSGDRAHGVVAATLAKRTHVAEALATLQEAGCDPHVLEAEGLVLANLAPIFGLEGTQLIADIGHEKTTFCAVLDGRPVLARSIPLAGRAMTEAIASELGLSFDEAEQSKCEVGALGRGDRAGAGASDGVLVILDRIAREALRTLEAAEARHGEGPVAREAHLTLVGGSARLDHIDEFLARRTGLETSRLRMPTDSPHAGLVEGADPLLFAPALALALHFSGESATQMNFRQHEYAFSQDFGQFFGRELRGTAALGGALLLLLVFSAATTIVLQSRREGRNQSAAVELYRGAFPDRESVPDNPVAALASELRAAQERADFLGLYTGNRSALELLAQLSRSIPVDLEVRISEINIDRNTIRLDVDAQGYEAADRLTSVLSTTDPFQGAKVAGSVKTDRRSGGVSFDVSIPLQFGGDEA
ncbi:MAG: pilus assembly protein PilM [Deltaproteobacteria bacterium]|nr:pilus assembly protein PilM [Deltaproteobacteria bacterium]